MNILENLSIQNAHYRCEGCGTNLGPLSDNYKKHVNYRSRPVQELGDLFTDPQRFVDDDIVIREFICPECGVLFDSEINRTSEPPIWDIDLSVTMSATASPVTGK